MISSVPHAWTNVLIVDDDPIQLELLETYFRKRQVMKVERAADGLAAKARLLDDPNTFDLIVMDVNMPNFDGIELMNHLKGCGYRGHLLIVSGAADVVLKATDRLARIGNDNYLGFVKKPFNSSALDEIFGRAGA